jgi:hypothetical protein
MPRRFAGFAIRGFRSFYELVNRGSRAALSQRLGYRASDLVQSNAIV